jgi:predicted Fe-Mo cluster-binding NifX family protein
MQICITSTGPTLESQLDPRFGRCPWFLFVDTDNGSLEAVENPNVDLSSGAGTQSAQLVADRNVAAVLTGHCGPKAQQVLEAAGTKILTGCEGTVRDVVERFRLEGAAEAGPPGSEAGNDSEAEDDVARSTERLDEPAATVGSVPPPMGMGRGFRHRHGQAGGGRGGRGGGGGRGRGRGGSR